MNPTGNIFVDGFPGGTLNPNPEKGNNVINHDEPGKSDVSNAFGNLSMEYTPGKIKIQSIVFATWTFDDFLRCLKNSSRYIQ